MNEVVKYNCQLTLGFRCTCLTDQFRHTIEERCDVGFQFKVTSDVLRTSLNRTITVFNNSNEFVQFVIKTINSFTSLECFSTQVDNVKSIVI